MSAANHVSTLYEAAVAMMKEIRNQARMSGIEDADNCEFHIPISIIGTDLRIVIQSGTRTACLNAVVSAQGKSKIMPGLSRQDAIEKAAGILSMLSLDPDTDEDLSDEYKEISVAMLAERAK